MGGELGGGVERRTQKAGMNDGWRTAKGPEKQLVPLCYHGRGGGRGKQATEWDWQIWHYIPVLFSSMPRAIWLPYCHTQQGPAQSCPITFLKVSCSALPPSRQINDPFFLPDHKFFESRNNGSSGSPLYISRAWNTQAFEKYLSSK